MQHFDVLIIGTGGGTKLRPASDLGKSVAIIEKDSLGGTCLNRGCIPSKMLIYPGEILEKAKHLKKFGIDATVESSVRWEDLVGRTSQTVQADADAIEKNYASHPKVTYFHGHARFIEDKVVEVNGQQLTADRIYIATGARPARPPIPGLEGTPYWTSTEALRSEKQPKSLIVIGGGYIALELGMFYEHVGTKVTYIARSGLLRNEDKDIRHTLEEYTSARHDIRMFTDTVSVKYENDRFLVEIQDKEGNTSILEGEQLLVATGVIPNADQLGLENTKIQRSPQGNILVNDYLETHVPGVYALGDVVGNYYFRHSVNFEGEYLFAQHFGNADRAPITYPSVPHAVFITPQIAGVGTTEDALEAAGMREGEDYLAVIQQYKNSAMGMAMLPDVGFVKLLVDPSTQKLLGAHILGEKASDLLHMLILAMHVGATVDQIADMIYIHPALSEVIRAAVRKVRARTA